MKKLYFLISTIACLFICNYASATGPSFQLTSAISFTNPITLGSYESVSTYVKNLGVSGTFDFEADLETSGGSFISVIGKYCGITVNSNATAYIYFNSGSMDAGSINPSGGAGSYRIYIIVSTISGTCPACGTKSSSCISTVSSGSYSNPVTLTVTSPASCSGWYTTPSLSNLTASASTGNTFNVYVTTGSSCSYSYASQNTSWLNVTSASGSTITYSVTANSGSSRTGYIWIYDANGTHVATFTVTQAAGVSNYVTSNFSYSAGCSGQTSYFYDGSYGNPAPNYWYWTFGDGNSSYSQNPSHVYSSSGYFTTTLYVQNSAGNNNTLSQQLYVSNSSVSASFTYAAGYAGSSTSFSDNSTYGCGSGSSWSWSFGDGSTSTVHNPSHTYTTAGSYYVQLTACNSLGQCNTYSQDVTISSGPSVTISGNVNDVKVNTSSRTIDLLPYGGITVTAFTAGTSIIKGTASSSSSDGSFIITVPTSGNYDLQAVDNNSNKVKMYNVTSGTNVGIIKVPATLLTQISSYKSQLSSLTATMSSLGYQKPISSYNVASQSSILNQWQNIQTNYSAIIETAGRLYLADKALTQFYSNADGLSDEVASDINELLKSALSSIVIFDETEEYLNNHTVLDFLLRDYIENLQSIIIDKLESVIDETVSLLPSDKYFIKLGVDAEIAKLQLSPHTYTSVLFDVLKPIVEDITAIELLQKEYVQPTQSSLNYANNNATNLSYSGTFSNHYNQSNLLTVQATSDANIAKINSGLHRDYSNIISSNVAFFNTASDVSAITGLEPLAAVLRALAIGGDFWSYMQLGHSLSIALTGFDVNKSRVQPALGASFFTSGHLLHGISSFPSLSLFQSELDSAIYSYDSTVIVFKNELLSSHFKQAINMLPEVGTKNKLLFKAIDNAYAPLNAINYNAMQSIPDYDSLFFNNFLYTLNLEPKINQRFQFQCIALLADTTDTTNIIKLTAYSDSLVFFNQNISPEFAAIYSIVDTVPSLNYIQNLKSSIPHVVENNSVSNCTVIFKNIGPAACTDLFAKISFDNPFITSVDSVYIGNLAVGEEDSLIFSVNAPSSDTVVKYYVTFYATNTIAENFSSAIKSKAKPQIPPISYYANLCLGDTLKLSTNDHDFYNRYYWQGPNGFSSNMENPVIPNFSQDNFGMYSCYISSEGLKSDTSFLNISFSVPAPVITGNLNFCAGQSTSLTLSQTFSSYLWSDSTVTDSLTVTSSGIYYVKVTDTRGCSALSSPVNVVMNPLPQPTITVNSASSLCFGDTAFLSSDITAVNYLWNNNETTQTIAVNSAGSYYVAVKDSNGCTGVSIPKSIIVNPIPVVTAFAANNIFCAGQSTTLTANGAESYLWLPGSGLNNESVANPIATPAMSTVYTVIGIDSNGCSNSATVAITINQLPAATIVSSGPTTFCAGDSVTLTVPASASYVWNDNSIGQSITTSSTGSYFATVTDTNNCSAVSVPVNVFVNPLPQPTIIAAGATIFCLGGSVTLSSDITGNYLWSTNDTTQNVSVNSTGSYSVTVTDSNGCKGSSALINVTVNPLPIVTATAVNNTICSNQSTQLYANGTDSYLWTPNVWLSDNSIANPIASPVSNITYTVIGTDSNGCSNSAVIAISINQLPTVDAGSNSAIYQGYSTIIGGLPTASGSSPFSYSWIPSIGLDSNNVDNPIASPSATTTYTVIVTDVNGCSNSDSVLVTVNVLTGISQTANGINLSVFPNPTNDELNVTGSKIADGEYQFELRNVIGQTMFKDNIVVTDHSIQKQYSMANFSEGMYFLIIENEKTRFTIKVQKLN